MTREYLERIGKAWLGIVTFLSCFYTRSSSAKSPLALFGWFQRILFSGILNPLFYRLRRAEQTMQLKEQVKPVRSFYIRTCTIRITYFRFSLPRNSFIYSLRIKWYLISANECLTHTIPTVDARGECRNDAKYKMQLFTYKIQIPLIYWSHYLPNNNT